MTNFSGAPRRVRLTRQQILIAVPLLAGALLSVAVFSLVLRPTLSRVSELRERQDELQSLQESLPALDRGIASAEQAFEQAEKRQALLVDLIADSDSIQTVLALLNQESMASGVMLMDYEPVASTSAAATSPSTAGGNENQPKGRPDSEGGKDAPQNGDPLEALGYRRTSMALRVTGSYGALLEFLRRVERLQVLVESSDLELEAVNPKQSNESDPMPNIPAETDLRMTLTFYDRQTPGLQTPPNDQPRPSDPTAPADPAAPDDPAEDAPS